MFSPLNDPQLELWFQRFNAPLKRLPAEERAALHQEVRQHLEALAKANEELGSSPEEAWEFALAQFGDPARIGRKLGQKHQQSKTGIRDGLKAVLFGTNLHLLWGVTTTLLAHLVYFGCLVLQQFLYVDTSWAITVMPLSGSWTWRTMAGCAIAYLISVTKRGWYKPALTDFKLTLPRRWVRVGR